MSLGASFTIKPSNRIRAAVAMMSLLAFVSIIAATAQLALWWRIALISSFVTLYAYALYRHRHKQSSYTLDISDSGKMILRMPETGHAATYEVQVTLGSRSTLWEHLLVVELRDQHNKLTALPVARDSLSDDGFRRLSVALRWIAFRNASRDHHEAADI